MRSYLIIIKMDDGRRVSIDGVFRNDWEAIDCVLGCGLEGIAGVVPRRRAA